MPITDWLAKLTDIVNLGKIIVDGAPGVVLAAALLIFGASWGNLPLAEFESSARYQQELHTRQNHVADEEQKTRKLAGEAARLDVEIRISNEDIATAKAELDQAKHGLLSAGAEPQAEKKLAFARQQLAELSRRKVEVDRDLEAGSKRLEDARKDLSALLVLRIRLGRELVSALLNYLIELGLLGYLLGTLLSPFNRSLFLVLIPRVGRFIRRVTGGFWWLFFAPLIGPVCMFSPLRLRRSNEASPAQEKGTMRLRDLMREDELRHGTAMILEEDEKREALENKSYEPKTYPASYYVGRGIISQDDVNNMVTTYYRWVEAAINLIVPLLLLGVALRQYIGRPWPFWTAIVVTILLYGAGKRGHEEYKQRLRYLIKGRLKRYREQREQAEQAAKNAERGKSQTNRPSPADS